MTLASHLSTFLASGRSNDHLSADDLNQMRATGTIEYVAGAVTLASVVLLPDPDRSDNAAYLILALIGVFLAALRFTAPKRQAVARASLLAGFVYITVIVAVARPVGPTPFFFLWPMLTTAYFLGRRDLVAATGIFTVALAAGLIANPAVTFAAGMFLPTHLMTIIVSVLVMALRERVDGLMRDLEYTASTDMLTGLANRRTFEDACHREIERARRSQTPMALAIFDLDHFKLINDRLGHAEGDRALKRFADILRNECRIVDLPARIGGEEFAVILSNADAEGARIFTERLIQRLVAVTANDPAPLSVSVGITELTDPTDTADLLLLVADRALYEAKNTGRGRAVVARPVPMARAVHTGQRLDFTASGPSPVPAEVAEVAAVTGELQPHQPPSPR